MTVTTTRPAIALLIGAALATVTSCAARSPSAAGTSTTPSDAAQSRSQATIAYAEHLAASTPQVSGEQPFTGTPPANLAKPDETIGVGDLVVRSRYWTAPGTADQVYRELRNSTTEDLRVTGYGLPSLRAEDMPGRGFLNFQDLDQPDFIAGGELYVEMEATKPGTTIIGAFGEAYPHPVREAAERIVPSGAIAKARWAVLRTDRANPFGKVVAHRTDTLTPGQTSELVDAFNDTSVADPTGTCSGPLRAPGSNLTVTVISAGQTWRLVYPGSCGSLSVARDGHALPSLNLGTAFLQLLEVLAHNDGTVTGRLFLAGGPSGDALTPAPGEITATGMTDEQIHTGPGGRFLLSLQPGHYSVTGVSPAYQINGNPGTCVARNRVTVRTNKTTHVNVYCQRR